MKTSAGADNLRHILILDDDAALLRTVGELFAGLSRNTWRVHLADTSARALKVLGERRIDLIVVDIQMPVVDGMQFLQLLQRKHPTVPKVVMTGHVNDGNRTEALRNGAELFLEKPRSPEGFEIVFATLNELVNAPAQEGFRGVLRKVGLPEVIQLECLGRKSSVLEVTARSERGYIYIESGNIIHAQFGTRKGIDAFNALAGLQGGEFNLRPFVEPGERTIEGPWEFLLMEAARLQDERDQQGEGAQPGGESSTAGDPTEVPAPASEQSELQTSNEPRQIEEFIVCSSLGDVLHEHQCPTLEKRLKLFDLVARRATQFGETFALGSFDRLEIEGLSSRVVTQIQSDRRLFVRSGPVRQP
ncbi:MAG TPA: response regulator [Methylomirabilota bacterium]|nr:response regulator [Methylomirabilota bacterium]